MDLQILHNKEIIYNFFKKNVGLHIYAIGDLDDFFWSKTSWLAITDNGDIKTIALLYAGMDIPTLQVLYEGEVHYSIQLLERIKSILPN
jgi:hypothetical protein